MGTPTDRRRTRIVVALAAVALPGGAAAQEPAEQPAATSARVRGRMAEAVRDWTLEYGGRLFVRDTLSRVPVGNDAIWRHERDLDQARVFATFEREILRLAIEVELAGGDAELKDTYIRLAPAAFLELQVGRFKAPMSMIWLESKWRLPVVERGILSELRQDDRALPFGGLRADGLGLELRPRVVLDPRFTAALFQNPLASGATPLDPTDDVTQDFFARVEIEPSSFLRAAASFSLSGYTRRAGDIASYQHIPLGGLELGADSRHLRVWLEGFAGRSFLYQTSGSSSGRFLAARALVAPRIRSPGIGIWRIEPFLAASVLDPTNEVSGDRVSEVSAGVNLAFRKDWRLQLDMAQRLAEGTSAPIADSTVIRIQLGARFSGTAP